MALSITERETVELFRARFYAVWQAALAGVELCAKTIETEDLFGLELTGAQKSLLLARAREQVIAVNAVNITLQGLL